MTRPHGTQGEHVGDPEGQRGGPQSNQHRSQVPLGGRLLLTEGGCLDNHVNLCTSRGGVPGSSLIRLLLSFRGFNVPSSIVGHPRQSIRCLEELLPVSPLGLGLSLAPHLSFYRVTPPSTRGPPCVLQDTGPVALEQGQGHTSAPA
jgi:hypothetical protein